MDWKDLAGSLVKAGAPLIGSALGGPIGGMIGGIVGKTVADALGVEATPEAVGGAIKSMPADELQTKLAAADQEAQARWPALAEIAKAETDRDKAEIAATGETMRAELVNGTPFQRNWRPTNGYILAALIAVFGIEIAIAIGQALITGKLDTMNAVFAGITMLVFFLSVPGSIVGAVSIGRSFEKVKALDLGKYGGFVAGAAAKVLPGAAGSVVGGIISKITKR